MENLIKLLMEEIPDTRNLAKGENTLAISRGSIPEVKEEIFRCPYAHPSITDKIRVCNYDITTGVKPKRIDCYLCIGTTHTR